MPLRGFVVAVALFACPAAWAQTPGAAGGPPDGAALFRQQCGACHVIDPGSPGGRQGPHLRGVVGRKAGSIEGFQYSAALKGSDFAWDEEKLDAYLTNPQNVVKGGIMPYRQGKQDVRQRIIEYLKEQS